MGIGCLSKQHLKYAAPWLDRVLCSSTLALYTVYSVKLYRVRCTLPLDEILNPKPASSKSGCLLDPCRVEDIPFANLGACYLYIVVAGRWGVLVTHRFYI